MSLDISLVKMMPTEVFSANITHNLNKMADAAGIYELLWRPDEVGVKNAGELVAPLNIGLEAMKREPEKFKKYDAPNRWGTYDDFVPWLERLIKACRENPDAEVRAWR